MTSKVTRGARSSAAVVAGRNIAAAQPVPSASVAQGPATPPISSGRLAASGLTRPGSNAGVRKDTGLRPGSSSRLTRAAGAVGAALPASTVPTAIETPASSSTAAKPNLETESQELRNAIVAVFNWCDADKDGFLSSSEKAAAVHLIIDLCPYGTEVLTAKFTPEKVKPMEEKGGGDRVSKDNFLEIILPFVANLPLSRPQLLSGLLSLTSRRRSAFDKTVVDFQKALVQNTATFPEEITTPGRPVLWRTSTGSNFFKLPPGAAKGPPAGQIAFKVLQFLGMRTEDGSFIDTSLSGQMMGHRTMFKQMLDMCGGILGVHVVDDSGDSQTVDVFLGQSSNANQMFRVRVQGMKVTGSPPRLVALGGFSPSPIDLSEIPPALLAELRDAGCKDNSTDLSALGIDLPQSSRPSSKQSTVFAEGELQNADLVLVSTPVARHCFKLTFELAGGIQPAKHYVMMVPRLKTIDVGNACYADHCLRVRCYGNGDQPEISSFGHFVVANVVGHMIPNLVVEHEFTSCRVRVQQRCSAASSSTCPVEDLLPAERANNLYDEPAKSAHIRKLLVSKGLGRRECERDIAFAMRLGKAFSTGYVYDVEATDARTKDLPPSIFESHRGDCSAFNAGFVYGLRAFWVPARISLGFKYGSAVKQACGAVVAPHAQAEFFANGIGWIPCDATMGVKRLGHDGGDLLSFLQWRPATLTVTEAQEQATLFNAGSSCVASARCKLQKHIESKAGKGDASTATLVSSLTELHGLPPSSAEAIVSNLVEASGMQEGTFNAAEFADCWAGAELGKFRELGADPGLVSTSKAGVKMYEGGPFAGKPLELKNLRENMMVQADVKKVMGCVGGNGNEVDWSKEWPYGVFIVNYDFSSNLLS